ncbi:MAG TPA: glycosyltransferase [Ardenticatenaceae bacterium]|jgi:glycosyltransferase involved in cell wall biosynthesis
MTARQPASLILTVLNEGEAIHKLMASLLAQTCQPDEVVIVDGGSTDNTAALLESYTNRLPLQVLIEPGSNISRGRNVAIQHAKHDLIAVTDAGVRLEPDWLEALLRPFEGPNPPDMVSGFFLPDPQGLWEYALAVTTLPAREEMGKGRFLPSSRSVAFTRAAWARVGGYPEWMTWSEDVLFDLAVINSRAAIAYQPEAIVWFRPRASLRGFARQYRNYAYGDGQGLLWPRRHAIRYATYLLVLPLLLVLLKRRPLLASILLLMGGGAMVWTPLKRHWRTGRYRWRALSLIPLIRIAGDVAKMRGFPQALREGWRNRARTRAYLNQQRNPYREPR